MIPIVGSGLSQEHLLLGTKDLGEKVQNWTSGSALIAQGKDKC